MCGIKTSLDSIYHLTKLTTVNGSIVCEIHLEDLFIQGGYYWIWAQYKSLSLNYQILLSNHWNLTVLPPAVPLIQHMESRIMIPMKTSPLKWSQAPGNLPAASEGVTAPENLPGKPAPEFCCFLFLCPSFFQFWVRKSYFRWRGENDPRWTSSVKVFVLTFDEPVCRASSIQHPLYCLWFRGLDLRMIYFSSSQF